MKIQLCTVAFALALIAPVAAAHRAEAPAAKTAISSAETADLRARFDPDLSSLRAGRVEAPSVFRADERAELTAASASSADLADLRGGYLTDHEWTLIAIGALVVLLIILI
jgi:hypothetical protein